MTIIAQNIISDIFMIQEELRKFIEQNCSGKEPSDLIMEAIGQKIEQMGADADEVLAFVEECTKGCMSKDGTRQLDLCRYKRWYKSI